MPILTFIIGAFFAASMGASGIAPAFCASCGSGFIKKNQAVLLYSLFVFAGAILLGHRVVRTLSAGITPSHNITPSATIVILISSGLSLWVANILKIPQSTSWVSVFSIVAVGLYAGSLNSAKLIFMFAMWAILPAAAYVVSFLLHGIIYPPRRWNLKLYEKIFANEKKFHLVALAAACYVAFAIGTNNVANAVGPLKASGFFNNSLTGLAILAPFFGLGAFLWGYDNIDTMGGKIAPLGPSSALIVNFVTASFIVVASWLGIPQSLVQLNSASIFALSHVKNGFTQTVASSHTHRIFLIWLITPAISFMLTSVGVRLVNFFLK